MANGTENPLKKARIEAGMTQKELADAVEGVSPTDISKAERGIANLTPEQLKAVADVLGTTEENLLAADETDVPGEDTPSDYAAEELPVSEDEQKETSAAASTEASEDTERETSDNSGTKPESEDETIINLFRTADPARQKAAISVLKGEKQVCPDIMSLFSGMMSGANGGEFVKKMSDFINSDSGKSMINTFKGMAANRANAKGMPNEKAIFNSLPTFTYCYSVTIYTLFLSFYFWQLRTDIKPEK